MKRTVYFIVIAFCLVASSCTTTGDPTTGGIFWSPYKAQVRQNALIEDNHRLMSELQSEQGKAQSLVAQRERLQAQLEAKKNEFRHAANPAEAAIISNEIIELEKQLAQL